jgi:hypothetical protein
MKTSLIMIASIALSVTACTPIGTPGGSSYYECSQGTRLRVDYRGRGAIVRVNDGPVIALRSTPSTGGAVFEGRAGQRLERMGNDVRWNTAARSAPEQCRQITIPR